VSLNGSQVLTNFDPYAAAGGQNMAVTQIFNSISPVGGMITLNFAQGAVNNPEVMAIQIIPQPATATFTSTSTPTLTPTATPTSSGKMRAARFPSGK
jgi:carbohydrate-binding DOMON domain-containing protein